MTDVWVEERGVQNLAIYDCFPKFLHLLLNGTGDTLGKVKGFSPKYKKPNKRIDRALSFDIQNKSRGIEFSVHDKEAQSKRKEAKGILRVEIRLMNIRMKGGIPQIK